MTLKDFKDNTAHRTITNPAVIKLLINEMAELKLDEAYKDGITAKKNGIPYREHAKNELCRMLGMTTDSPEIQKLGGMLREILSYGQDAVEPSERNDYINMLTYMAYLYTGFI